MASPPQDRARPTGVSHSASHPWVGAEKVSGRRSPGRVQRAIAVKELNKVAVGTLQGRKTLIARAGRREGPRHVQRHDPHPSGLGHRDRAVCRSGIDIDYRGDARRDRSNRRNKARALVAANQNGCDLWAVDASDRSHGSPSGRSKA
jgi:hypothetical protein